ncbi:hypothetical protein GNI_101660 [Gregarina niphandrodes]|uniref:Uncharacterized protein n=1 Tax=Gregarina niphandrodes TaxID=110365 RepID=A0A023B4E7_GRENI|nr:hypothetical protein GNI_101660 [Gregarina niphandrodes]EZG56707.1 hypothetical protein GNI_101660 [Gregarina niphandrodes]|eukprot:XP_011131175.1 hypothetical protein GNI_101660 [Gregarina niphandrodes]
MKTITGCGSGYYQVALLSLFVIHSNLPDPSLRMCQWWHGLLCSGKDVMPKMLGPMLVKLGTVNRASLIDVPSFSGKPRPGFTLELSSPFRVSSTSSSSSPSSSCLSSYRADGCEGVAFGIFRGLLVDALFGEVTGLTGGLRGVLESLADSVWLESSVTRKDGVSTKLETADMTAPKNYSDLVGAPKVTYPDGRAGRWDQWDEVAENVEHFMRVYHYTLVCDKMWRGEAQLARREGSDRRSVRDDPRWTVRPRLFAPRRSAVYPTHSSVQPRRRRSEQPVLYLPLFSEDFVVEYPEATVVDGRWIGERPTAGRSPEPHDADDIYLVVYPVELYKRNGSGISCCSALYAGPSDTPMSKRLFHRSSNGDLSSMVIATEEPRQKMSEFLPFDQAASWVQSARAVRLSGTHHPDMARSDAMPCFAPTPVDSPMSTPPESTPPLSPNVFSKRRREWITGALTQAMAKPFPQTISINARYEWKDDDQEDDQEEN